SLVRTPSVVFVAATLVAVLALLPVTMPRLRPWRARPRAKPRPAARPAAPVPPAHAAAASVPDVPRFLPAAPAPFPGPPVSLDPPAAPWEQVSPNQPHPGDDALTGHDPFSQIQHPDAWPR
ncbi:MAG TPA: hypothetical protein VGU21_09270, partial [Streptosporangiaceae bacterium]|nr:hypothetical protein [Streptosporangiaceae bacterium]